MSRPTRTPPPRAAAAAGRLRRLLLPFSPSATPLHAATYLLGIALFSIAFLVFLNSAVSFVVTDLLGVRAGVGGIVGTLGFVDEVVALAACPLWGLASDRLGVRWVAVLGYGVIGAALLAFVQARTVPGLVAGRVVFALGASAAATMVTAALPVLTGGGDDDDDDAEEGEDGGTVVEDSEVGDEETGNGNGYGNAGNGRGRHNPRGSVATSLESDATITPERFTREQDRSSSRGADGDSFEDEDDDKSRKPSTLAGYVGLFTGCGALVALILFLPLPARFSQREGVTPAQAITYSFYVVGGVAFFVAIFVFFGFKGLKGEEEKGWRMLLGVSGDSTITGAKKGAAATTTPDDLSAPSYLEEPAAAATPSTSQTQQTTKTTTTDPLPYRTLLLASLRLGITDPHIALGYLGGFVARASTVAISLFIPLYVNAYFIGHGFCTGNPDDPSPDLKRECRAAYLLASALTGAAQLVALLCAPLFGYLSGRGRGRRRGGGEGGGGGWGSKGAGSWWRGADVNVPVLVAAGLGVVGYVAFPQLPSPEFSDKDGRGGSPAIFLVAALLGISQIGAIVCSLGSLGRGVLGTDKAEPREADDAAAAAAADEAGETEALLAGDGDSDTDASSSPGAAGNAGSKQRRRAKGNSRIHLKGSIAGVYSLCGGAAILLLTKLGGFLFDATTHGAPFYMMAAFNAALFVVSLGIDLFGKRRIR